METFRVYGYRIVTMASVPIQAETEQEAIKIFEQSIDPYGTFMDLRAQGCEFTQDGGQWESFAVHNFKGDPEDDVIDDGICFAHDGFTAMDLEGK